MERVTATIYFWLKAAALAVLQPFDRAWSFFLRVLAQAIPLAIVTAVATLLYQIAATEMQAEALSWDILSSQSAAGHLGKVAALEHLNRDSTFAIPQVGNWLGLEQSERSWYGFSVSPAGDLLIPVPPHFRERTDLQGLNLSPKTRTDSDCPADRVVLAGLRLQKAKLKAANFECVVFSGLLDQSLREENSLSGVARVDFSEALLHGANFSSAVLDFADFEGANIQNAIFNEARLLHANFKGADGQNTSFIDVVFSSEANLSPSNDEVKTQSPQSSIDGNCRSHLCFPSSCLKRANFNFTKTHDAVSVDFRGADLSGATIHGQMVKADFGPASADGNRPQSCSILRTPERNAHSLDGSRTSTDLSNADLRFTVWRDSNFSDAIVKNAWLMGADLSSTNLTSTQINSACIDDFTVLPATVNLAQIRRNTSSECVEPETEITSQLQNNDSKCKTTASTIDNEFSGKVVSLYDDTACIELKDGTTVALVDVSVRRIVRSIESQKEDQIRTFGFRQEIQAELDDWVTADVRKVRCVKFQDEPVGSRNTSSTQSEPPTVKLDARQIAEAATMIGWCAFLTPDKGLPSTPLSEIVSTEARKLCRRYAGGSDDRKPLFCQTRATGAKKTSSPANRAE